MKSKPQQKTFWASGFLILILICSAVSPGQVSGLEITQVRYEAEYGDKDAAYFLGIMYRTGMGVSSDCLKALKWTKQAALQGHTLAQSHLGKMYSTGCGEMITKDPLRAYKWTALAAKQGLRFAGNSLQALENQLHPYVVAEAQQEIESFKPAMSN